MKRDLFAELMEGVKAMREDREGKITLRRYTLEPPGWKFLVLCLASPFIYLTLFFGTIIIWARLVS